MSNDTAQTSDDVLRAKSRRKLLIIFAMFAVPLLAATVYLHMVRSSGGSLGNTANGELVNPAVPMQDFSISTLDGEVFDLETLRGLWTLMYLPKGPCAEVCEKNIYHMRQVRLALNHRMSRVQRVVVAQFPEQLSDQVRQDHPGLKVLSDDADMLATLAGQIDAAVNSMSAQEDVIYLFDPFGNLMMRFAPDVPPKKILEDLKHLLKVSRIG
ncbi:MAG: SCO family protein [Gammaproteobacteria bacterium]|nr:SCO family protein [Gammaproteobacteria bacterium]